MKGGRRAYSCLGYFKHCFVLLQNICIFMSNEHDMIVMYQPMLNIRFTLVTSVTDIFALVISFVGMLKLLLLRSPVFPGLENSSLGREDGHSII